MSGDVISPYSLKNYLTMGKKSVKLYTDNVIEEFYKAVINNSLDK